MSEQQQLQKALALLESWLGRYGGIEYVPRNWGPSVWVCQSCRAETRATSRGRQAGPPQPFPHTVFCKAEATRALLAKPEPAQEAQQTISQQLPPAVPPADPDRPVRVLRVRSLGEETSLDASWKAGQHLTRAWHQGKITTDEFKIESLKLVVDLKERSYLRCASSLLDAKKFLARAAEELERACGQNTTTEEIRALLAEREA
jgi:hypothetical protein